MSSDGADGIGETADLARVAAKNTKSSDCDQKAIKLENKGRRNDLLPHPLLP